MFRNTDRVPVDYLLFTRHSRLIYVILVSFVLGAFAGQVLRGRRRKG
jgi:uncharacterized integral membrane protein